MLSVCVTPPDRPLIFKSITSSVTLQTTGKSGKISVKPYPSLCIKLFDERKQFLPSGLMLYFRIVWGYTEIFPNVVLSVCVTPSDL